MNNGEQTQKQKWTFNKLAMVFAIFSNVKIICSGWKTCLGNPEQEILLLWILMFHYQYNN